MSGSHAWKLYVAVYYGYFSEWSYILLITTIKISIGLFYLRIIIPPWQRLVVKCTMWIVVFFGFAYFWTPSGVSTAQTGGCLPNGVIVGATYAHSTINAGTDWALALLPILMLWNVHMPVGVKFIVGGIVACGILASTTTLIRISSISAAGNIQDWLFDTISLAVWSTAEPGVAIFAACIATLRPLLCRLFPNNFRRLTVRKQPELRIPANLAGKGTSSDDVEMGDTVKTEDGKKFEPEVEDSSRTIEIHWDERNGDGNLEWVDTPTTFIQRYSGSSSGSDSRELEYEIEDSLHTSSLRSSRLLPPTASYKRDSGSTLASDGLEEYIEDYPRTQLRPSPQVPTLTYTPSSPSPTIPPPTSPSPSHLAFCMRDSQYSRNSKIEPSSPI
ncbi:hypothetical protein EYC84_001365 [Monilinia fructicola]|uniref:Rhodopsin domain-containing protein n=1 Tax=Monilinia fructicola TaxID=38448 RepID=A0A5M9JPR7_MONFR|nr:hypothetical protein EYC84_001365 [Monilinia fructicola]